MPNFYDNYQSYPVTTQVDSYICIYNTYVLIYDTYVCVCVCVFVCVLLYVCACDSTAVYTYVPSYLAI